MKHQICHKRVWGCVKDDIRTVFFLSALSSCTLSVSAVSPFVPPHERTVPAMHGMTPSTPNTLSHIPSLPLVWPFVPSLLFSSSPIWSLFVQNPPVLSSFLLCSALVDTDVGCLLELSNRKFPESFGAQNWARNNRKVERETNPTRMIYDWIKTWKWSTFLHCSGCVAFSI